MTKTKEEIKVFGEAIPYKSMQEKIQILNKLKKLRKKLRYVNWDVEEGFIVYQVNRKVNHDVTFENIEKYI
jgi:3-polyprenyl-4-hydroxybenzoate decarboxylase